MQRILLAFWVFVAISSAMLVEGVAKEKGANIDFGDNTSEWANDGECDDPRFEGSGVASTLLDEDLGHDANDCRSLLDSGQISFAGVVSTSVSPATSTDVEPPIHTAAITGSLADITALLASGADVNVQDVFEYTALHLAAIYGHPKIVSILLEAGANIDAQVDSDHTALQMAVSKEQFEVVSILLEAGADVNLRSYSDYTALHLAAEGGHSEIVLNLLEAGADIDAQLITGHTALHVATTEGHSEIVSILSEVGASSGERFLAFGILSGENRKALQFFANGNFPALDAMYLNESIFPKRLGAINFLVVYTQAKARALRRYCPEKVMSTTFEWVTEHSPTYISGPLIGASAGPTTQKNHSLYVEYTSGFEYVIMKSSVFLLGTSDLEMVEFFDYESGCDNQRIDAMEANMQRYINLP